MICLSKYNAMELIAYTNDMSRYVDDLDALCNNN